MPFDDEENTEEVIKSNLKISSKKSITDLLPKKDNQKDFDNKVKQIEDNKLGYQKKAAELTTQFYKIMSDKTLLQNKNIFQQDIERDILKNFIELSKEINNDPNEDESMGSLSCIVVLFRTCLSLRDRLNNLEYELHQLKK